MQERVFVHAPPEARTAGADASSVSPAAIDPTLRREASGRLALTAGALAAASIVAFVTSYVLTDLLMWTDARDILVLRGSLIGLLTLSVGTWLLSRSREIGPKLLLDIGLVYEVLAALGLALPAFFNSDGPPGNMVHISWVCVWVIFFPLIVPARPLKNLIASVAAASTVPLALGLWIAAGHPAPEGRTVLYALFPAYMSAALALVPAHVVHALGTSLLRTRSELRSLGSYRLAELLGQGGMGEVWRAEHDMLARTAAIKLIRQERLANLNAESRDNLHARFEREARVTANLRCPHTVELYDFGVTENGALYYVMELLEGMDLDTLVYRHGPMPPPRVVHVLRQTCASLAEAHNAGLVHRDIKPANLFLARLGLEDDFVKVLDFGLARPVHTQGTQLTSEGIVVGTLAFMPPEMATAKRDAVDGRSDIYSLGAVAYTLLTGEPPFTSDSPASMLYAQVHEKPVAPSDRLTNTTLPPDLETLVLECLAKDPSDRPQSAHELSRRLKECDVGRAWDTDQAREWWRRAAPRARSPVPA